MKRREYTLEPETVAEKDGIKALKSAINDYTHADPVRLFHAGGQMAHSVNAGAKAYLIAVLQNVDTDNSGRDANGIDIRAALKTLDYVKEI